MLKRRGGKARLKTSQWSPYASDQNFLPAASSSPFAHMSVKAFASSWVPICQILLWLGPSPVTYELYCDVFKRALPPRDIAPRRMIVAHVSSNNGPTGQKSPHCN